MAADQTPSGIRGQEIVALLNEVRQRVRARYPGASVPVSGGGIEPFNVPLADLTPLVQARDAAQAKVASIGSVNPRRGGAANAVIQRLKRATSRALGWFVRDQITFNREVMACVEAAMEAMAELNHSVASTVTQFNERLAVLGERGNQIADMYSHWLEWRVEWEKRLGANEFQFLRTTADLQTGFSNRATLIESNFRDIVKAQHADYLGALDRSTLDVQKRLWADLEKIRNEYERLIQGELRILRQRVQHPAPEGQLSPAPSAIRPALRPALDYQWFAERFRGPENLIRTNQKFYLPYFQNIGRVLDLGCGRGEFLELLRDSDIPALGVDDSAESVAYCQSKGLEAERADLFEFLTALPGESQDAIFCSQVVEHLDPMRLPEMIRLCASRLRRGGILTIETPNPACLAIFATYFYLDPTHTRPVPSDLAAHYMHEFGLGNTEVRTFSPAADNFPALKSLPADFVEKFFGGLDYGIIGWKL